MAWFTLRKQAAADIPTPATDKVAIFVDSTSGDPSYMGDDGIPHSLVGSGGGGVSSLNGRTGPVVLDAGTNMSIVESPTGTFTFNASGGGGGGIGLPWFFFEDYGGDPTGVSDSTTAVQDCINAAAGAGGGVCASKQVNATFKIGGALQDTARGNAQILFPSVNYVSGKQITIRIAGYVAPPTIFSVIGSTPLPTTGLIFKSTLASGTGAVFGGWGPVGTGLGNFSNVCIGLERFTVQTVANPTITAIDCGWMACLSAKEVVCHTGTYAISSITAPTTATSFGIITPKNGNGAHTALNDCTVIGFYNAYDIYEHATGNNVNFAGCNRGLVFNNADHASYLGRVCSVHCVYPVVGPASGAHRTTAQVDIEHSTTSFVTIADLYDPGNRLFGTIDWYSVHAGTPGPQHLFTNVGGQNCQTHEVGNPPGVRTITTTDTAVIEDNLGIISYTGSSAINCTIPPESGVPWKVGTLLTWRQTGTGQITLVAGSGVTFDPPITYKTRAQGSFISAQRMGTNSWAILGGLGMMDLLAAVANSRYRSAPPPTEPASWDLASFGAALTRSVDKLTVSKGSGGGATYSSARSVGQCPATSDRYFKVTLADTSASPFAQVGIATAAMPANGSTAYPGGTTAGHSYYEQNGNRYTNAVSTAYGTSYATGAVILVAYKGSTGQLFFRKNGVWQNSGNPSTGAGAITVTPAAYYAAVGLYANGHAWTADFTSMDSDPLLSGFTPWVP